MFRCLLFFFCAPVMAGVTLHEQSVVSEGFIRLGDIAVTEAAELRELRIAYSPRPGGLLVLERAEVQRALARLKPGLAASVEGAERVTVRRVAHASGVTRNQPVVVRVSFGAIALETTAVASRDGRPGEVIRVRNTETNQTYPARVAGPGVVEALWR